VDALIPGVDPESIGDWKILYRISSSENSVIYFGSRGPAGNEEAAIKVIGQNETLDKSTLDRLKVEVDALEKLNNPHVAKLVAKNLDSIPAWIAIEFLGRKSLETKLKQDQSPIEGIHWWELARAIFSGLSEMHSINIIHRDIKPANIMMDGSAIKIIDFGISYVPGHTAARDRATLQFEGSRLFAAPENFSNRFKPTMDVFSAAVTLAYAARLKSIWKDDNEDTLKESICKGSPDLSDLSAEQIELLNPLLDKFASQRPTSEQTLKKIHEYIEHFANSEVPKPIPLRGSSVLYRLLRNRGFQIASSLLLLFIIVLGLAVREPQIIYLNRSTQLDSAPTLAPVAPIQDQIASNSANNESETRNSNEIKCDSANRAELYDEAIKFCLEAIKQGDVRALFLIGTVYTYKKEDDLALRYFKQAAEKGYERAYGALALHYDLVRKNIETAKIWYEKAQNTNLEENLVVASMYLIKNKEFAEAEKVLLKANSLGSSWSSTHLGLLYKEQNKIDKAKTYLLQAAQAADPEGMWEFAEFTRIQDKDLEVACKWYTQVSKADNRNKFYIGKAQNALINYCQSGLTGAPPISDSVVNEILNVTPYNSEALRWIIPSENIDVDYNFLQFKISRTDNPWRGISYVFRESNDNRPWLDVIFSSAAVDKCIDFRLIKVEKGLVTKIWTLSESNCYSFSTGSPVRLR
jgi:serine/threonine protein kinase